MTLVSARVPPHWAPSADSLAGKVILITGASGGLGRAAALACADAGATVVLSGKRVRSLEKLYDQIVEAGGSQPAIYPLDLAGATPADYAELADNLGKQLGGLDGLVHCAAYFDGLTPLELHKAETWLRGLQVNLSAPFLLTQACLPLLTARVDSACVFVLDDPERMGRAHWGGYGVSKAGLAGLCSILHQETDGTPLRVHALVPSPMNTALRRTAYAGELPHEQPGPERAAAALVYLLSSAGAKARGAMLDLRPAA